MAVSKRLRYEILRRDNNTCQYCGATAPDAPLTVDHVTPVALGGTDEPTNLVTACRDCNAGKSSSSADSSLVASVESDALRWAAAIRRAAEIDRLDAAKAKEIHEAFADEWDSWTFTGMAFIAPMPGDWTQTIDTLTTNGMTLDDLISCARVALTKDGIDRDKRWRYFCGVCWRTLERRQSIARDLLTAEDGDR